MYVEGKLATTVYSRLSVVGGTRITLFKLGGGGNILLIRALRRQGQMDL